METKYIGEHLLPGHIGHFAVILAFIASIVATIAYFKAATAKDESISSSWKKMARTAFFIQVAAIFTVFGTLFFIISHHYFEYHYAWEHSSRSLPAQYLLACFWEGQEGSFLLWAVWHCVLGSILIFTSKSWEKPVMTIISFAQFCLASMLLGIYFFGYKVGSNPFILLRNAGVMPFAPGPNYLSMIKDGVGLNALLQNYWMVIHPPVLFLGFASTIVPFSFAFAGLWRKRFTEWVKPAMPWALFSAMVLGTGVMMGAAWAYESLTFGGYWAWDPVENASLVPWLMLVAGIHTMLVFRSTGHSLKSTFFFLISTFILVLYSTFLTRSGILGDTSVHAFTDLGMSGQLLIYLFIFLIPAFGLFIYHYKKIPSVKKEEQLYSREFWMFIGSLVLFLSAIFIIFTTSVPVWNKLLKWAGFSHANFTEPVDREFHYNRIQIFIAILIALGTGTIQYFKYKNTSLKYFGKKIIAPLCIAIIIFIVAAIFVNIHYDKYGAGFLTAIYILLFASIYAVVANIGYIIIVVRKNLKTAGASIAHIGFGLMLLGILLSSSKKQVISLDRMGMMDEFSFSDKKDNPRENTFLPQGVPVQMANYEVTYLGDSTAPGDPKIYYNVSFVNKKDTNANASFVLHPDVLKNTKGMSGFSANPNSKHFWNEDVFTYVNAASNLGPPEKDTAQYQSHLIKPGDTVFLSNGYMILNDLAKDPVSDKYTAQSADIAVGANLSIYANNKTYHAQPLYLLKGNYQSFVEDTITPLALYLRFQRIIPEKKEIQLMVKQSAPKDSYIVLKAYVFPFINILWIGTIIMILGFALSIWHKIRPK